MPQNNRFNIHRPGAPKVAVVSDFDGTIVREDTNRLILESLADPAWLELEDAWLRGEMGSLECIKRQFALVKASRRDILSILSEVHMDPHFPLFVDFCRKENIPLIVASDGMDVCIHGVLSRIPNCEIKVFCNQLVFSGDHSVSVRFPNFNPECRVSGGTCKCQAVRAHLPSGAKKVLIGDGRSDFCVARAVDLVLAKDALLDYCRREGIPHAAYRDFGDALQIIGQLLEGSRVC